MNNRNVSFTGNELRLASIRVQNLIAGDILPQQNELLTLKLELMFVSISVVARSKSRFPGAMKCNTLEQFFTTYFHRRKF